MLRLKVKQVLKTKGRKSVWEEWAMLQFWHGSWQKGTCPPHLTLFVVSICAVLDRSCLSCTSFFINLPPLLFITHTLQLSSALWLTAQKLMVLLFFYCNLFTSWKTIKFQKVLFIPEIWFYLPQNHSSFFPATASFFLTFLSKDSSAMWESRG